MNIVFKFKPQLAKKAQKKFDEQKQSSGTFLNQQLNLKNFSQEEQIDQFQESQMSFNKKQRSNSSSKDMNRFNSVDSYLQENKVK